MSEHEEFICAHYSSKGQIFNSSHETNLQHLRYKFKCISCSFNIWDWLARCQELSILQVLATSQKFQCVGLNPVLKDLQQGNRKDCQIHTIRSISVWKATHFLLFSSVFQHVGFERWQKLKFAEVLDSGIYTVNFYFYSRHLIQISPEIFKTGSLLQS